MSFYEYTALDQAGKTKSGIIDADSTVAARQKIRGMGVFPVDLKETTAKPKIGAGGDFSLPDFLGAFLTRSLEVEVS